MKIRLYLDNCAFNRPYDDLSLLKNYLEAEAKIYIQNKIFNGDFELSWSYIMDYEIFFNPFSDRKNQIMKWKNIAVVDIDESEKIITRSKEFINKNIKTKDALHLSCAIEAKSDYFITTDDKVLNKSIDNITVINPIDFIRLMGV